MDFVCHINMLNNSIAFFILNGIHIVLLFLLMKQTLTYALIKGCIFSATISER